MSLSAVVAATAWATVAFRCPMRDGRAPGPMLRRASRAPRSRRPQGSLAEFAVVPGDRLCLVPPDLDVTDLVAAAHPAASASLAVFRHGRLRYGETVYVGGGAGHVGSTAVALASAAGARVVTTARADDRGFVASLGATEAIDYALSDAVSRVGQAAPDGLRPLPRHLGIDRVSRCHWSPRSRWALGGVHP